MSAEQDIAAIDDGGENTAAEVRAALTSILRLVSDSPPLDGPDDDDFTDPSLTDWTEILPSGTNTLTAGEGFLSVQTSGQGTNELAGISKSVSLSVGDSVQTGFRMLGMDANHSMVALVMGDGNTQSSDSINLFYQTGSSEQFITRGGTWESIGSDIELSGGVVGGVLTRSTGLMSSWIHMRLTYQAANTFRAEVSLDGVGWYDLAMSDSSRTITPSTVGIGWTPWGTSSMKSATFKYFKVNRP